MHKTTVLQKVTHAVVTRVRKCVQAIGGHFKLVLALVLNCVTVTVQLTTGLNAPSPFLLYLLGLFKKYRTLIFSA